MNNLIIKLKQIFLHSGCKDEKEYQKISTDIFNRNKETLKSISFAASFFLLLLILLELTGFVHEDFLMNHIIIFCVSSSIFLILIQLKEKHLPIIIFLMYAFMGIIYTFGIVNGISFNPDKPAISIIAILLGLPIMFVDRPIRIYIIQLIAMTAFIITDKRVKPTSLLEFDIPNVIIYGFIGMIVSHNIIKMQTSKYLSEYKLRQMSAFDILTGVRNRNSYEENLTTYPMRCKFSLACLYIDANGLHDLNNTKGHQFGDKMLCCIADTLGELFPKDDIYRIGGDEFVTFIIDMPKHLIEDKLKDLNNSIQNASYNISFGLSIQTIKDLDISKLIISAEQKMYRAKALYYRQNGIDRRKIVAGC